MRQVVLLAAAVLAGHGCFAPVEQRPSASATIGAEGGTLALAGKVRVAIPPGALTEAESVSIRQVSDVPPSSLGRPVSASYSLEPEELVLAIPAKVDLSVVPADETVTVVRSRLGSQKHEALATRRLNEGAVQAVTTMASVFTALVRAPDAGAPAADAGPGATPDAGEPALDEPDAGSPVEPPPVDCGAALSCPGSGCLGDSHNCGACGSGCPSGGCFGGWCRPSGWNALLSGGSRLVDLWAGDSGDVVVAGIGLWVSQPDGTFVDRRPGVYHTAVWADGRGVILAIDWGVPALARSEDYGATWTSALLPMSTVCWRFWGVGDDVWCGSNPLLHSLDRGKSWSVVPTGGVVDQGMDVWGADRMHLYATGVETTSGAMRSFVLYSADGGASWKEMQAPAYMWGVHGTDLNNVWAVGEQGTVLRCDPEGCRPAAGFPATTEGFRDVFAVGDEVFVGGRSLYRSSDRGLTWTVEPLASGGVQVLALAGRSDGALFAADGSGVAARFP